MWESGGRSRLPVGSGTTSPQAESFFQYVITQNSIMEHENKIFASQ